jgi:hypothetical protein
MGHVFTELPGYVVNHVVRQVQFTQVRHLHKHYLEQRFKVVDGLVAEVCDLSVCVLVAFNQLVIFLSVLGVVSLNIYLQRISPFCEIQINTML